MKSLLTTALLFAMSGAPALAQNSHAHATQHGSAPYAGQQLREIASLSAEEQQSFLDGRGMGLAKSAELNGYPGPLHVLELEQQLRLTAEQRTAVADAFERMKARATAIGQRYVEAERAVDLEFKSGKADAAKISARVAEANRLLGEVRLAHLAAHLEIMPLLTAEQRAQYALLRGYAEPGADHKKYQH